MMPAEMTCHELVEQVTTYLEDAMPPEERERFEAHRRRCPSCETHVSQVRLTVSALGLLRSSSDQHLPADPGRILELFRTRGLHSPEPRVRDIPLGLGSALAAPG